MNAELYEQMAAMERRILRSEGAGSQQTSIRTTGPAIRRAGERQMIPSTPKVPECHVLRRHWMAINIRPEIELVRFDLAGENLSGVDLGYSNLRGANLTGADFSGANLYRCSLADATIRGADFSGANLQWSDLTGANAAGADFSAAGMYGARLFGCNLSSARLKRVDLDGVYFSMTNLEGCGVIVAQLGERRTVATPDGAWVEWMWRPGRQWITLTDKDLGNIDGSAVAWRNIYGPVLEKMLRTASDIGWPAGKAHG